MDDTNNDNPGERGGTTTGDTKKAYTSRGKFVTLPGTSSVSPDKASPNTKNKRSGSDLESAKKKRLDTESNSVNASDDGRNHNQLNGSVGISKDVSLSNVTFSNVTQSVQDNSRVSIESSTSTTASQQAGGVTISKNVAASNVTQSTIQQSYHDQSNNVVTNIATPTASTQYGGFVTSSLLTFYVACQ
eukprot:scaffold23016_cov52-Cyclotella_meneghiniana.AAC.2